MKGIGILIVNQISLPPTTKVHVAIDTRLYSRLWREFRSRSEILRGAAARSAIQAAVAHTIRTQ